MISFTIDCASRNNTIYTFTAEKGMTWNEWFNSSYNTTEDTTCKLYVLGGEILIELSDIQMIATIYLTDPEASYPYITPDDEIKSITYIPE